MSMYGHEHPFYVGDVIGSNQESFMSVMFTISNLARISFFFT
jgi:hypothetical protein